MTSPLEMSRTFKKRDPESYQRIVKRLYCQEVGVDYEEKLFVYEESSRRDSTGCLSAIMAPKCSGSDQDFTEARVGSLYQVVEFLGLGKNVVEEGIFRKAGTVRKQQELLERIERGEDLCLEEGQFSIHECASVLKTFLGNLTEPLATSACYKPHLLVANIPTHHFERRLYCTQLLLELIPHQYYSLLKDLLFLLNGVAQREAENKMTASNLGMMFSTHILCPKSLSAEDLALKHPDVSRATTFMIENPTKLFRLPDSCSLITEVQKFISRRSSEGRVSLAKRSNLAQPGVECLIANTVFSFVDKEEAQGGSVKSQVENTVVSQLNISLDILEIKNN